MKYYTYLYRDIDGTPIYIGKGKDKRAFKHFEHGVKTHLGYLLRKRLREGIRIEPEINYHVSEEVAFATEVQQILFYGRIDLKTGTLFNRTDGGEGMSGWTWTDEHKEKHRKSMLGNTLGIGNKSRNGQKNSVELNEKIRIALTGKPKGQKEIVTCPHCDKSGTHPNMSRYHMDNCKFKGELF